MEARRELRPESLLPHRGAMLLVDRIVSLGESEIHAVKQVRGDEHFLDGHYPDYPIVPGVITCECLFQAGAALLASRGAGAGGSEVPVVARIESAKFRSPVRPGDELGLLVRIRERLGGAWFLTGEARVGDRIVATVSFACAMAPKHGGAVA